MRSKVHRLVFQVSLIDEDNDGDSMQEIWIPAKEWIGNKNFAAEFPEYLAELNKLVAERTLQLNSSLPEAEPSEEVSSEELES